MTRRCLACGLILGGILLARLPATATADGNVKITDPGQVAALTRVQERLDQMSGSIMACLDTGMAHGRCMCENRELLAAYASAVQELFEAYPGLARFDLVHFEGPDGILINQSLEGIRRQAQMTLDCP